MESYFVVNGSINKKILNSIKKHLYPPSFTRFINITIFISGALAFFFFLLKINLLTIIFLIGALVIYVEKLLSRRILIKKILNIIGPGQSSFNYKLNFYNSHMTLSDELNESGFDINYSNISRITETKENIALFTRENMCFPINISFSDNNEKYEWLDYIVEKNKKIKLYNIQ
ncbi:hypothetical protein [Lacrimispora sp. JR3]|uniref:hypothetical protein n=1 Tax=Lacrimispora sinapis TaxID=3111456 RepID=UPI003748EFE6